MYKRQGVQCVISKGDPPLTVVWLKDGSSLTETDSGTRSGVVIHSLDQFNSILTIEALARHHGGNYTCIANNAVAQTQHMASLSVNGTVLKTESKVLQLLSDCWHENPCIQFWKLKRT